MDILTVKNFKCYGCDTPIPVNRLTVLAGKNSVGKSSVIQSLLLLYEAIHSPTGSQVWLNNGKLGLNLGIAERLINFDSDSSAFRLGYQQDSGDDEYFIEVDYRLPEQEMQSWMESEITGSSEQLPPILESKEIYYLSSERTGPRMSTDMGNLDYIYVGPQGVYSAQVLGLEGGRLKVDPERLHPDVQAPILEEQVNAWLNTVIPNTRVSTQNNLSALRQRIIVRQNRFSDDIDAPNVGFGISYVLPIIITCLTARKDRLVIIENPEAHLHPAAQTAIGMFIARMADAGLTIMVETHSDHVLDGIRLYAAENKDFKPFLTVNCFSDPEETDPDGNPGNRSKSPGVIQIELTDQLQYFPYVKGFLDQTALDFIKLRDIQNDGV